jgi:hypothetical protein
MRVQVYKNLIRGNWSIRANGKVIDHRKECMLANVIFHVGESSRLIVIAKRQRSVHAWATGELVEHVSGVETPITYRPYEGGAFIRRDNGQAIHSAEFVHFTRDRGAVARGALNLGKNAK